MARSAAFRAESEPGAAQAVLVGLMLLVTAAPGLALLLAVPGIVPAQGWLCQELGAVAAAGALLLGAARLGRWRR
jgi:hypothetical protein